MNVFCRPATVKHTLIGLAILSLLTACTTVQKIVPRVYRTPPDAKAVQAALQAPDASGRARIRIYPDVQKPGLPGDANFGGQFDFLSVVGIEKGGKKRRVGFSKVSYALKKGSLKIGMPPTERSKQWDAENKKFNEYNIQAGLPVVLGYSDSRSCNSAWFFPECYIYVYQYYFIPESGKDYEVMGKQSVSEIQPGRGNKPIEIEYEIVDTYKD